MKKQFVTIFALILALTFILSGCVSEAPLTVETSTASSGNSDAHPTETQSTADPSASGTTPPVETVAVTGVDFPLRSVSLEVGQTQALTAAVTPENATDKSLNYIVGDESVFSYDGGMITAKSAGSAVLVAQTPDGRFTARCYVNVSPSDGTTTLPTQSHTASPTPTETPTPTKTPTPTETPTQSPTPTATVLPITSDTPTVTPPTITPTTVTPTTTEEPAELEIVTVPGSTVRHLFTHCLIIDPAKGCGDPHVYPYGELDTDCLTVSEFKALLQSLYDNNYCLININDMYVDNGNGGIKLNPAVRIYKGKKPLVISIDDVTYDPRKKDCGMISRLVVDANGNIAGEIDNPDGSVTLNYEECFCLLEEFLKTHPDFSFEGSKFTLALTGFVGILGYRTDEQTGDADYCAKYKMPTGIDYMSERAKAQKVVDWFKSHGYNFASHTYSHSDYTNCSLNRVLTDIEKWNRNVKPMIGETRVLVYPYGAFTYADTEKHQKLMNEGFAVFCGTSQLNTLWDGSQPKSTGGTVSNTGTIYLERFTVTGFTLRNYASRTNYINYYTDYYKELGNDEETAKSKAIDLAERLYDVSHNNSLEYYDPAAIYDSEHRYYQILP